MSDRAYTGKLFPFVEKMLADDGYVHPPKRLSVVPLRDSGPQDMFDHFFLKVDWPSNVAKTALKPPSEWATAAMHSMRWLAERFCPEDCTVRWASVQAFA